MSEKNGEKTRELCELRQKAEEKLLPLEWMVGMTLAHTEEGVKASIAIDPLTLEVMATVRGKETADAWAKKSQEILRRAGSELAKTLAEALGTEARRAERDD